MTYQTYLEKDSDTIYEEFIETELEEVEDDYRMNDRMNDMINRYGRY